MSRKRPRVLFYSNLFPDQESVGRGIHNARVLEHLAEHIDFKVISPRARLPLRSRPSKPLTCHSEWNPEFPNHYYVPKVGDRWNASLMASGTKKSFNSSIRSFSPDVILGAWLYPDGVALKKLSKALNIPLALIAQGSDVHQYLNTPTRRTQILHACTKAAQVITRSSDLRLRLCDAGIPEDKVTAIYNGVDTVAFPPKPEPSENITQLLYVGNFYQVKNPLSLISAIRQIHETRAEVNLTMIGNGPLLSQAQALINEHKLNNRVLLKGAIPPDQIAEEMRRADLLVVPSINEGVPNVILEAFASGLPVVATAVGGIPEILKHGAQGMLSKAPDPESLSKAINVAISTSFDSAAIREHAETFSRERTTEKYLKVIEEMIASRR